MCGLKVRFSQSPEKRGVFQYALRVEVVSATGIPSKIFVFHQMPAGAEGNTFAEFDHVATPVDFQEIPEDAASETVPWFRTDKCTVWLRSADDLVTAKQLFVDDINSLRRTFETLMSTDNFTNQTFIDFTDEGVHETGGERDSMASEIAKIKNELSRKVDKDILDGVEVSTNSLDGIRTAVKEVSGAMGAKVLKSVTLAFALSAAMLSGTSNAAEVKWKSLNAFDLDDNPLVVVDVSVDAVATDVSEKAAGKGVTFVDSHGEDQNVAVEIGKGAKAAVSGSALDEAPPNTVARSVSVAIGAFADATVSTNSTTSQAIAIGFHSQAKASNAIAVGSGAQHPDETAETGDATVASESEAQAYGYSAKATAKQAVQFGRGVNNEAGTFQFRDFRVIDANGQIPVDRLQDASSGMVKEMYKQMDRALRPGNMEYVADSSDDKVLEPRLDGVSEVTVVTNADGIYKAGNELSVVPPLGSRNYDIVISEIPQFVGFSNVVEVVDGVPVTNKVEYNVDRVDNFCLTFSELMEPRDVRIRVDQRCGYKDGELDVVLTNAPCIVKVREVSTNRLYCVVKPFDVMEDL